MYSPAYACVRTFAILAATASALLAGAMTSKADEFYKGKRITMVVTSAAGGGYDLVGRLVARHYGRFIPGSPSFVVTNMPGASDITGVNYLFARAPKDGTVIGAFNSAIPFLERIGTPAVAYKSAELSWIGNLTQDVQVAFVWADTGVKTLDDVKSREVLMGSLGGLGTTAIIPRVLNATLGTKFKLVLGYSGTGQIDLAIERGEIEGRGAGAWATTKNARSAWIEEKKIVPLVQVGPKKAPDLPNVPLLKDLATNEEQKQIFDLLGSGAALERPFAGPPNVPAPQIETLRKAFDLMAKDPEFLADAKNLKVEVDTNPAAVSHELVVKLMATPQPVVDKLKSIIEVKE